MKKVIMLFILFVYGLTLQAKSNICEFSLSEQLNKVSAINFEENFYDVLMNDKVFLRISICAPINFKNYLDEIEKQNKTNQLILIYSLQVLTGESYSKFVKHLVNIYSSDKINIDTFERGVFPGWIWSTYLVENYKDKNVIETIDYLRKVYGSNDSKLNDILTGKSLDTLIKSRFNSISPIHSKRWVFRK
ncbi:hypothetical protein [Aliikangiella maris]|uniref:Uncharacterized protein n=2 Tax=Aliikangiella maris TaxID=3162458 RepID=A0ABV2C026_9GAMM